MLQIMHPHRAHRSVHECREFAENEYKLDLPINQNQFNVESNWIKVLTII